MDYSDARIRRYISFIVELILINYIDKNNYFLDLAKCEYYLTSEVDYKDYIPLNRLSIPSNEYLHKFKFHVLMLTQHPIKFVLSKANRSINLVETTTRHRQYRTTTPYYPHSYNGQHDVDYGNNGEVEMELPTIPQSVRYHDSNDHIEYKIGIKRKKNHHN